MDRPVLTPREQQLLDAARRNPPSREAQGKAVLGITVIMLVIAGLAFWFDRDANGWTMLSQAMVWVMFGVSVRTQTRFEATALGLIAKLDRSYADRVPPLPTALGLDREPHERTGRPPI